MPEFIQNYNFNSLYVCLLVLIYNACKSNYEYINIIFNKLCLFNYYSLFIVINMIGLFLILNNLSFEINIKWSVKFNNLFL
jgi:hypothetical protein